MDVTVDRPGEDRVTVAFDGETYGDLLRAIDLSPQAATVVVDGRPVPADDPVDASEVQVLRLISGGDDRLTGADTRIRPARPAEADSVIALLDEAMLAIDRDAVRARIGTDEVLVARIEDTLRGAIVLDGRTVTAIAVAPSARGRGVGAALVADAAARRGSLRARFDASVRPFYASLGFEISQDGERFVGKLDDPLA